MSPFVVVLVPVPVLVRPVRPLVVEEEWNGYHLHRSCRITLEWRVDCLKQRQQHKENAVHPNARMKARSDLINLRNPSFQEWWSGQENQPHHRPFASPLQVPQSLSSAPVKKPNSSAADQPTNQFSREQNRTIGHGRVETICRCRSRCRDDVKSIGVGSIDTTAFTDLPNNTRRTN